MVAFLSSSPIMQTAYVCVTLCYVEVANCLKLQTCRPTRAHVSLLFYNFSNYALGMNNTKSVNCFFDLSDSAVLLLLIS
jgi:hypothetical protein